MTSMPPLLDGIIRSMRQLGERQRVIAENIANSDTPHFKAKELGAPDFTALLVSRQGMGGTPRVSAPHIAISDAMVAMGASRPRDPRIVEDADTSETKPDGNNVTLEDQLLKMGQIQADFSTMTSLYRKQMALIDTALGRGA